jgi:hypothetical protein
MHVLAFFFADEEAAAAADAALRTRLELTNGGVRRAPLAVDGEEGTVVALSVKSASLDSVVGLAGEYGGRLVADIPEEWIAAPHR